MAEGKVAGQGPAVLAEIVFAVAEKEHRVDCCVVVEIERDSEHWGLPLTRIRCVFHQAKPFYEILDRCRSQRRPEHPNELVHVRLTCIRGLYPRSGGQSNAP